MRRLFLGMALLLMLPVGCGRDSTPQCTPGESARCFCPEGEGAQTCQSDGTFGECVCGGGSNGTTNNASTNMSSNGATNGMSSNNMSTTNGSPNGNTNGSPNANTNGSTNNANTNSSTNNATNNSTNNNTNPGGPTYCKQTCVGPADCAVFGDPAIWDCVDTVCELKSCTTDDGCVKQMSNWSPGCNSSGQCGLGFACVTVDGQNYCAFTPLAGVFGCDQLQLDEVREMRVDDGQMITVCGAPDALCEQSTGNCYRPCAADSECRPAGDNVGLVCLPETGQCGCTEDAHCTISGNVCINGECGCSSQNVCDVITSMSGVQFVCSP